MLWIQPKCLSMDENKENVAYTGNGVLFNIENMTFSEKQMELEMIILSERNQSQR